MPSTALTGKDTVQINGRILNDFVDGDCVHLTFPNDLFTTKTGKNGNSIIAYHYQGQNVEVSLRILRGSSDDKFLNGLLADMKNNPPLSTLMTGQFAKNIGDGAGNIITDTSTMTAGTFKKQPEVKENAEGDVEQAVTIYTLTFANCTRTIG